MLREFFSSDSLEDKIEENQKKLDALLDESRQIDEDTEKLFKLLEITPGQINTFLADESNIREEDRERVQQMLQDAQKATSFVKDVHQSRQTYKQRAEIQREWLFVR